ncbi:PadR family transcriptional regulator [Carnobacterium gallinarum]|uniref:PadR family transcriptional regulator n=1 Tax=Carnobacterium gallinarum TaxID=2749 RepID=UPI0005596247|nr:PadR family transcriptional regulator [Carnobacterium gallinarum]
MIPLLILGLLKEHPGTYGYELLSLMKDRNYKYVVNFTKGSFYYNLQQMEEKGLIRRVDDEVKQSKETHNYIITTLGDQEFQKLMYKYGSQTDYVNLSFYAPMLFEEHYNSKEFEKLIQIQMEQTQEKITNLEKTLEHRGTVLPSFAKMLENSLAHHLVNLKWYEELLREVKEKG